MWGLRYQWFPTKMNGLNPGKWKSLGATWVDEGQIGNMFIFVIPAKVWILYVVFLFWMNLWSVEHNVEHILTIFIITFGWVQPKSLERSPAVGDFYGTRIEIWAGFGPVRQLLRPVFSCFHEQKKILKNILDGENFFGIEWN